MPSVAISAIFAEGELVAELTALFTNRALTAPPLDLTVFDRVRAGTTCSAEILAAFNRLRRGDVAVSAYLSVTPSR